MKRALLAALLAGLTVPAHAQTGNEWIERVPSAPVQIELQSVPLGALVTMLMRDVMKVPYSIAPDVLQDRRPVSVNLNIPRTEIPVRVVSYLRGLGLSVDLHGGTVFVSPLASSSVPPQAAQILPTYDPERPLPGFSQGLALDQGHGDHEPPLDLAATVAVVTPAFRDPMEMSEIVQGVFPDLSVAVRQQRTSSGDGLVGPVPDRFVVTGPEERVKFAMALVRELDSPRPSVTVRGVVLEVRKTDAKASALGLLASVLGGRVEAGSNVGLPTGDQYVRIATGGLSLVLSAVSEDSRFHVVAEPSLTALSGTTARINSGSEVPTIGAVSFADDGTPVRSVVYRQSGVSLTVRPVVRGGEIELEVTQERSSFARTETGVNDSPTLNTSSASTLVSIAPGETIALAGLDERLSNNARQGLFGGIFSARNRETRESQLVVLLQADIAQDARAGETSIVVLTPPEPVEDEAKEV